MTTPDISILMVDDDPDIRDLVGRLLEREGYRMRLAESGSAMDAELQKGSPDLIILDLMMPGEDGLSICRRLRAGSAVGTPRAGVSGPSPNTWSATDPIGSRPGHLARR